MANGRVITGFSKPWVAKYTNSGTTISYTLAMPLARGVDIDLAPGETSENRFYADNLLAETDAGTFNSGTLTLTVDGLLDAAEKLIQGLPAPDEAGWTHYGADQEVPFVGIGFIIQVQQDNKTGYIPVLLRKAQCNTLGTHAATKGENIEWQTQEITARLMRDDSANSEWKWKGTEQTTEAAAEAMIKTALGYTP